MAKAAQTSNEQPKNINKARDAIAYDPGIRMILVHAYDLLRKEASDGPDNGYLDDRNIN